MSDTPNAALFTPHHHQAQQQVPPLAQPFYPPAPSQYPYGWPQQPYGWLQPEAVQSPPAPPQGPSKKWALDDEGVEPPNTAKMGGAGRGHDRDPGHLWALKRLGHYEERPAPPFLPGPQEEGL